LTVKSIACYNASVVVLFVVFLKLEPAINKKSIVAPLDVSPLGLFLACKKQGKIQENKRV